LRIDQLLVERGLAASRSQAQRLIAAGVQWRTPPGALPTAVLEAVKSSVEWRTINKNKDEVPSDAEIVLLDDSESKYVSRGGLKLEGALLAVAFQFQACAVWMWVKALAGLPSVCC
jgi:23S rRNA (cytidine1920-2'-O)/16S rRNA (cytidine1409-2'-O)-methyltransferase